jgi:hypothetical protein
MNKNDQENSKSVSNLKPLDEFNNWINDCEEKIAIDSYEDQMPFDKIFEIISFDESSLNKNNQKKYQKILEKALSLIDDYAVDGLAPYGVAEMVKYLDLTHSHAFFKFMTVLPHIKDSFLQVYIKSSNDESYNKSIAPIRNVLDEKKEDFNNNYLLTTYLKGMFERKYIKEISQTMSLTKLTNDTFLLDDKRTILKNDNSGTLEALVKEYHDLIDSEEYQKLHGQSQYLSSEEKKELRKKILEQFKYLDIQSYEQKIFSYRKDNESLETILDNFSKTRKISKEKIKNFSIFITTGMRQIIEKDFNIDLSSFSIPEQFSFFEFIHTQTFESIQKPKEYIEKYQTEGFRAFLALQHGSKEVGDKILDLGQKLPEPTAKKIFAKYGEIIDSVQSIIDVASNGFKKQLALEPKLVQTIEQSLYKRGAVLLENLHTDIINNQKDIDTLAQSIEQDLDRMNADTLVTLSVFKHALKNGYELPLSDISGAVFSKQSASEFSQDQIHEMKNIYKTNWESYPDQVFVDNLIEKFSQGFENVQEKSYLYTFSKNDHIRAFVRFATQQDGSLYASALNVDESTKGLSLGEAMMDGALYQEAQHNVLHAKCDPYNESNMRYFEKGFIAQSQTQDTVPLFEIMWDKTLNESITAKQMTQEQLVLMYLRKDVPDSLEIVKALSLQELHNNFTFDKALVRCFKNPVASNEWYAVYEKIN